MLNWPETAHLVAVDRQKRATYAWKDAPATKDQLAKFPMHGVIPASVDMLVIDVDHGDVDQVAERFTHYVVARSGRPGRGHVLIRWSRMWDEVPQTAWELPANDGTGEHAAGDTRYDRGYVVVYDHDAWAMALELPFDKSNRAVVKELIAAQAPDESKGRNVRLFEALQRHEPDSDEWNAAIGAAVAQGLSTAEVQKTVNSVKDWRLDNPKSPWADPPVDMQGFYDRLDRLVSRAEKHGLLRKTRAKFAQTAVHLAQRTPWQMLRGANSWWSWDPEVCIWREADRLRERRRYTTWLYELAEAGLLATARELKDGSIKISARGALASLEAPYGTTGANAWWVSMQERFSDEPTHWDKATPGCVALPTEPATNAYNMLDGMQWVAKPEDRLRCRIGVEPQDMPTPQFDAFIEWAMPDAEVRTWFMRWWRNSLLGVRSTAPWLLFLYGAPGSGKSTIANMIATSHAEDKAGIQVLNGTQLVRTPGGGDRHPTWLTDFDGPRLVFASEYPDKGLMDSVNVKLITTNEPVTARKMGKDFATFMPTAALLVASNHPPSITPGDGMERRLAVIGMPDPVPEDQRDSEIDAKLSAELPGVLARLLRPGPIGMSQRLPGRMRDWTEEALDYGRSKVFTLKGMLQSLGYEHKPGATLHMQDLWKEVNLLDNRPNWLTSQAKLTSTFKQPGSGFAVVMHGGRAAIKDWEKPTVPEEQGDGLSPLV